MPKSRHRTNKERKVKLRQYRQELTNDKNRLTKLKKKALEELQARFANSMMPQENGTPDAITEEGEMVDIKSTENVEQQ